MGKESAVKEAGPVDAESLQEIDHQDASNGGRVEETDKALVAKEVGGGEVVVEQVETKEEKSEKDAPKAGGSVSIFKLFAFADGLDYLLILIGTLGAAAHGAALPVFFLFFGKLLDGFGANVNNPKKTADVVSQVRIQRRTEFSPC